METSFEAELSGVVVLTRMDRSLTDYATAIKYYIEEEQTKINPDNGLLALLCDAARVGKELIDTEFELHKLKLKNDNVTRLEMFKIIDHVCDKKMSPEDFKDIATTMCSLIDSYDPTLVTCDEDNCPVVKDMLRLQK
jgi:hypothetical protein